MAATEYEVLEKVELAVRQFSQRCAVKARKYGQWLKGEIGSRIFFKWERYQHVYMLTGMMQWRENN